MFCLELKIWRQLLLYKIAWSVIFFCIFAYNITLTSTLKFLIPLEPALFIFDPPFGTLKKKDPPDLPTPHQSIYEHSLRLFEW